jgi:hypothetical protein
MAKQAGTLKITGTIDDLTYYKMDGKYYVRLKSSLTGRRFWKHPSFEGSRKSCSRFGEGNRLASQLYRMVAKEKRVYPLFCFLKKRAIALLKEGKPVIEAADLLVDYLVDMGLLNLHVKVIKRSTKNTCGHKRQPYPTASDASPGSDPIVPALCIVQWE